MRTARQALSITMVAAVLASAGCSSDSTSASTSVPAAAESSAGADTPAPSTQAPATSTAQAGGSTTAVAPALSSATTPGSSPTPSSGGSATGDDSLAGLQRVVDGLAADALNGRNNGTADSLAAQDLLIGELSEFAQPLGSAATGPDAFRHAFDSGTNVIGLIPGTDLADQYVIVGAHYDHLGHDCRGSGAADNICNGATDNATGVAAAIAVGRAIARSDVRPRRSVIVALWDAEEDGLLGSAAYVDKPIVPLAQTVAYVNFDIQGANISPALRDVTVMIGAETGGPNLVASGLAASQVSSLHTARLSVLFGQGRSDHVSFVLAGVPSVLFTDGTPPCYHTVGDDASIVDYPKLVQQERTAEALVVDLAGTDHPPVFDGTAPPATFADAQVMYGLAMQAEPDFVMFSAADRAGAEQYLTELGGIVAAGANAFDAAAMHTLLSGAVSLVTAWSNADCDGFLEAG